jgi:outer membrane receptor protein involved in Fe transport
VSDSYNPGLFAQATDHLSCDARVTVGGRLDHVQTSTGNYVDALGVPLGFTAPDRNFDLWSTFVSAEYDLNCEWTATAAIGHGQRAPTLTELYVNQTFIAGMQNGVNFYEGNPNLAEERATQVDVGLIADYCNLRGSVRGFYTWVDDYITYVFIPGAIPLISGYGFVNTDYATLSGFEVNGEYDLNRNLTLFGQMAYTEGRDQQTDTPLYGIYPLQSRVGVRLQNGNRCRGWGVEFSSRIVDDQDRIAGPGPDANTIIYNGVSGPTPGASRGRLDEFFTPGFTTYDLRTYYRFSDAVMLTGGVENLTDKLYFEHFDYHVGLGDKMGGQNYPTFQRGRNFYIGAEARY